MDEAPAGKASPKKGSTPTNHTQRGTNTIHARVKENSLQETTTSSGSALSETKRAY